MGWLSKKTDPISDRARTLNAQIAALEGQIQKLDSQLTQNQSHPRLRSTAIPHGATLSHSSQPQQTVTVTTAPGEPVFEEVDQNRLKAQTETNGTPEHYNELGVRKYDLAAVVGRMKNHLRGPSTANPKLVSYLAAGSIQGLRPLRYEKRVARNRLIGMVAFLFLILIGIVSYFVRHR